MLFLSASAMSSGTKLFVGNVLEARPREASFIMRGGASKKYARVTIVLNSSTRWSGIDVKSKAVKVGDSVRVTASPAKDGAFLAVTLTKLDPNAKPSKVNTTKQ